MVINFRTQMTTSYAELGETCVATTAQLGIVIFFCCAYATAAFRQNPRIAKRSAF